MCTEMWWKTTIMYTEMWGETTIMYAEMWWENYDHVCRNVVGNYYHVCRNVGNYYHVYRYVIFVTSRPALVQNFISVTRAVSKEEYLCLGQVFLGLLSIKERSCVIATILEIKKNVINET